MVLYSNAYNYEVKYEPSEKHRNADALPYLSLHSDKCWSDLDYDYADCLLNYLPIIATKIQHKRNNDCAISKI